MALWNVETPYHKTVTFGTRIRRAREAKGLSQQGLADALRVKAWTTVSRWENDHARPRGDTLARLTTVLGVSEAWLRGMEPAPPPSNRVAEPQSDHITSRYVERHDDPPDIANSRRLRVWRKQFELELAKAGVDDEHIEAALALVTSPLVLTYYAGGARGIEDFTEEEALRAMEAIANFIRTDIAARGARFTP